MFTFLNIYLKFTRITCNHLNSNKVSGTKLEQERLARWRKWRASDVGEAKGLENELWSSSFSKSSVASPTSQLILQPFFRFYYVTGTSLTSPGETPRNWSFRRTNFGHVSGHVFRKCAACQVARGHHFKHELWIRYIHHFCNINRESAERILRMW